MWYVCGVVWICFYSWCVFFFVMVLVVKRRCVKTSVTLDPDVLDSFKVFCASRGMKVSTRLQFLARLDVKRGGLKDE